MFFVGVVALLPALVSICFVFQITRTVKLAVGPWADERGLLIDSENRPIVEAYLKRSRTFRLLGALAGLTFAAVISFRLRGHVPISGFGWISIAAGYAGGITVAEITLSRPPAGRAAIRSRDLAEYLSPWALRAQRRTAGFAAAIAAIAIATPMKEPPSEFLTTRIATLVAIPVVLIATETLQRWIIRRPQPIGSNSQWLADDAIRRQSVHSIAGASMALQWLLVSATAWALAQSELQLLRWTMVPAGILAWAVAIGATTYYDRGGWQRRSIPTS